MSLHTTFTTTVAKFRKSMLPFSPSEIFKSHLDSHKKLLECMKKMDEQAGKSSAAMREAYDLMDKELDVWMDKIGKQLLKEKEKKALGIELDKFKQWLAKQTLDYRQSFTALQEQEQQEGERSKAHQKGQIAAKDMTRGVNDKKFAEAIKYLQEMREREVDSQSELASRMLKLQEEMQQQRVQAEKLLAMVEQHANQGEKEQAAKRSELLRRMAQDAIEKADNDYHDMDRQQKGFEEFRNHLNWGAVSKKFDLEDLPDSPMYEKAYGVELQKRASLYSKGIERGLVSIETSKATIEIAKDIGQLAEQAVAFTRSGEEMRKFLLLNLMDTKGDTLRGTFHKLVSGDPQKSVDHQLDKLDHSLTAVKKWLQRYMSATEQTEKDTAKQSVSSLWKTAEMAHQGLLSTMNEAKETMGLAKKRIPTSLQNDPLLKRALMDMGTALLERQQKIKERAKPFETTGLAVKSLKLVDD